MNNPFYDIIEHLQSWSELNNIPISTVVDTSGVHSVKIFSKDKNVIKSLLDDLKNLIVDKDLYLRHQKVRGGVLFTFSRNALSEAEYNYVSSIGENMDSMSFRDKITKAMNSKHVTDVRPSIIDTRPNKIDFDAQAHKINEAQYKTATKGMLRSNQSSLQRETHGVDISYSGKKKKGRSVKESWSYNAEPSSKVRLAYRLNEALEGMATSDGLQSSDIFANFSAALKEIGTRTGVGPIQDRLKERGIKYKKSDDGNEIILYVVNDETNAPQPIARISAETISNQTKFQEALQNMIDLSQGQEPGAFESFRIKMQEQEKAVREVAKVLAPQDASQQAAVTLAAMPKTTPAAGEV